METNIIIKKGLFKRRINLEDIIFENMIYGTMDGSYRLVENEKGKNICVYNKKYIGRGFKLSLKRKKVIITLFLPAGKEEIKLLYDYVVKICNLFNTNTFKRNKSLESLDDIKECIKEDENASTNALKEIENYVDKDEVYFAFCALNLIALSKKDLKSFNGDIVKFGKHIDTLQKKDVYYARASIFTKDDKVIGVYSLVDDINTVLPYKPFIFNNNIKIDKWYIGFTINGKMAGTIKYDDFIKELDSKKEYDSMHFIAKLNSDKIDKLLKSYKVKM